MKYRNGHNPKSNENERWWELRVRVKREQELHESWQARVCVRVFSTLTFWSNDNKSWVRVNESWQTRVSIWEFSQLSCSGQTRTRFAWELTREILHGSFTNLMTSENVTNLEIKMRKLRKLECIHVIRKMRWPIIMFNNFAWSWHDRLLQRRKFPSYINETSELGNIWTGVTKHYLKKHLN